MKGFISNKGRTITAGQKVKVYYNLHKHLFSIKDYKSGLVLGYAETVELTDATFKVSEVGRKRVLREKKKNVHAYVVGSLKSAGNDPAAGKDHRLATYNPYKYNSFVDKETEKPLKEAKEVKCFNKQLSYK